jgi:hypothetical protein
LVIGLPLEQALSVVIAEDGFVEANYKDPKDPRKKGVWSDTVTHRPLGVQVVLGAKFSHLATKEAVESVCAIRLLKSLVVDMMEIGMLGEWSDGKYIATTKSVQEGKFWASKSQKMVASERLKPLLAKPLGTLIRDLMKDLGVWRREGNHGVEWALSAWSRREYIIHAGDESSWRKLGSDRGGR